MPLRETIHVPILTQRTPAVLATVVVDEVEHLGASGAGARGRRAGQRDGHGNRDHGDQEGGAAWRHVPAP